MLKELGRVIENMLHQQGMWQQYRQNLVVVKWAEAVGKNIAEVTRARQFKKGRLWVTVKDSTWAYHLSLLKPQLLEKINDYAGGSLVQEIYFKIGGVDGQGKQAEMSNNTVKESEASAYVGKAQEGSFVREIRRLKEKATQHRGPASSQSS